MGREVRRVPAGWDHPKNEKGHLQPLFDRDFETAMQNWLDELQEWKDSEFARVRSEYPEYKYDVEAPLTAFVKWHGEPPDPKYCRPRWTDAERTYYQLYENVTEGTPLSPPFATKEELVDYIVANGDGWGNSVSRKAAEAFVDDGYAPSMVIADGQIYVGIESSGLEKKN